MGHTYASLPVHVVFSTKGRLPTIREPYRERLRQYLTGIVRRDIGQVARVGGTENHIHLLLLLRPDVALSDAMRKLKSVSSAWVHDTFPGNRDFGWQTGYSAFAVSPSDTLSVERYIDAQEDHHREVTFEEELAALLKENGIEYDPRYLWD
jgi:REP element-mobilizing transposase RayT